MSRRHAIPTSGLLLALALTAAAAEPPAAVPGLSYRLDEVAAGVFCAIASGVPYFVSNSVVIVGDDEVAVVDPGAGPNEARVLLAALDFETVIPGHGAPFKGKDKVAPVEACLRDLWRQAETRKREGVPAEQAAAGIDLRAHASRFPSLAQVGFNPLAVRRIYEVIDERAASRR